ncbi:MAG: type II toxin-antitoxin system HicA family toxin [Lachnospiraceae bacterium]|nr:type II toxin-antitoxin system HicA family toxin [Lachnospiraceae bacterium]
MNNKNKRTYKDIYIDPVRTDIVWSDIEALFKALGASVSEGNGSRIRVMLNGERAVFHRPHPEKTTDKGAVKAVRRFLENAGVIL